MSPQRRSLFVVVDLRWPAGAVDASIVREAFLTVLRWTRRDPVPASGARRAIEDAVNEAAGAVMRGRPKLVPATLRYARLSGMVRVCVYFGKPAKLYGCFSMDFEMPLLVRA